MKTNFLTILYGDNCTGFVRYGRTYHGILDDNKNPIVMYTYGDGGKSADVLSAEKSRGVINQNTEKYDFSPERFKWGDRISPGASQLALALLLEHYTQEVAEKYYWGLKSILIGALPEEGWSLDEDEIRETVEEIKEKQTGEE